MENETFSTNLIPLNTARSGEVYVTKLAERGTWEDWERQGRPDMVKRAQQRAQNLLEQPPTTSVQMRPKKRNCR